MDLAVAADLVILLLVLILPLVSRRIEHNLEAFLFAMGVAAALAAEVLSPPLLRAALVHPLPISGAVLVFGVFFKWFRPAVSRGIVRFRLIMPIRLLVAGSVTILALLSSVITVIIASLVLIEIVSALRFSREDESRLVVVACMALGLGAVLTPIGEPLSTIAVAKLGQDFWYLLRLLGPWVVPAILLLGGLIALLPLRYSGPSLGESPPAESYGSVFGRAARVFLFVMALTLLGEGFKPVIDRFVIALDARILYWINMVSAILDNATLTAAEISPRMNPLQIRAVLMGLLVSGGMLIPGNIPNIIAANRLGIRSRTWARVGIPLGLILLLGYFAALFLT